MKKKGVGRKQRSCQELVTQSTDREERNLPPARGPVPKSHVRVSMGLTRQPAKVRGHGEFLSLGAELGDTRSISFLPSWRGTTNPDTQASHNSNGCFLQTSHKVPDQEARQETMCWESFPTQFCQWISFLGYITPGFSRSSRTRGQKWLHSLIVWKKNPQSFPSGPRTELHLRE